MITNVNKLDSLYHAETKKPVKTRENKPNGALENQVSSVMNHTGAPINSKKVAEIKAQIENGTYSPSAAGIANKMIQDWYDFLSGQISGKGK